jgi:general secretion pathway protein E
LQPLAQRIGLPQIDLKEAVGCEHCANTGYSGRIAVLEYLRCDDHIRTIPKDDQFLSAAKAHNRAQGGRDLLEDGLLKAMAGETTIEEVLRVCG